MGFDQTYFLAWRSDLFDWGRVGEPGPSAVGAASARRHHKMCKTCLWWVPRGAPLFGTMGSTVLSGGTVKEGEVAAGEARNTPRN